VNFNHGGFGLSELKKRRMWGTVQG
jgi:hypothetical protein